MMLNKLPVSGSTTNFGKIVGQGLTALVVGAGGVVCTFFSLIYHFCLPFPLSM